MPARFRSAWRPNESPILFPVLLVVVAFASSGRAAPGADAPPYAPVIATESDEAQHALKRMRLPRGFEVRVFAAEPMLANPVTFCTDAQGRFYVAETFRHHAGVTDNRNHMDWLDDDLASRTVEDRVAMYRKHLGDRFATYTTEHERVRRIEDLDGDGRADRSTIFADGFHDAADGIGAGLLARGDRVWFACIPTLWLLRDTNQDGQAHERRALHTGYGVHVAFLGHDLHGLKMGPDGRLYFSIGDRGFHIETEGRTLSYPDTGAVLRCEPDGSGLEVFATGLRNPQELAFDEFGNLFTGDNNSDGGDRARWVHVVEGGDSGWRMGYQYITWPTRRGPWNLERLWTPEGAREAAYLIPPLANLADGPSGLTYYPGTGLTPEYQGHFFLADFRGSGLHSGVHAISVKPRGASFEVADSKEFVWSVLATDVDFGVDSALYISDWVEGWDKPGKGRLFKVTAAGQENDPQVAEVKRLLSEGMQQRDPKQLFALLGHADSRIRQEAQFALAERGESIAPDLVAMAQRGTEGLLARIHAIWALGQIARSDPTVLMSLIAQLDDENADIRAQVAKVFGDVRFKPALAQLTEVLADREPRVQFYAALAVGKTGTSAAIPAVCELLKANDNRDAYLRHAGVMALTGIHDRDATLAHADDESAAVRMGVLLALRRW